MGKVKIALDLFSIIEFELAYMVSYKHKFGHAGFSTLQSKK